MNDESTTLTNAIQMYHRCASEVEIAEAAVKDLKRTLAEAEERALAAFADAEVPRIDYGGRKYEPITKPRLHIVAGKQDDAVAWLMQRPEGANIVKPTVHAGTRDSVLRQMLIRDDGDYNIPDDLVGIMDVYRESKLSVKKV